MAQYYLSVNGQQLGPFEVNQLIPNGMTQNTMVWTNGMPSWAPASSVPELAQLFMAPPASSVPPFGANAYGAYSQPSAPGIGVDKQKLDFFIMSNKDNFPTDKLPVIQQALARLDEGSFNNISMMQFKSPMTALLLSIFCGSLGVDRFYIGDTGLGIGKLLTAGGCGIWAIIDWFKIQDATRQKNFEQLTPYI